MSPSLRTGTASSTVPLPIQAPLQGPRTHNLTVTAHSVTDDNASSCNFNMYKRNTDTGYDDKTCDSDTAPWEDSTTDNSIFDEPYSKEDFRNSLKDENRDELLYELDEGTG